MTSWGKRSDCMSVSNSFEEAISYHNEVGTTDRVFVFHSHCNYHSTFSVPYHLEATNFGLISENNFNSQIFFYRRCEGTTNRVDSDPSYDRRKITECNSPEIVIASDDSLES